MNAVLFYITPTFRLTGSTINALEYFLAGFEYNPELKLVLINGTIRFKSHLMNLASERYVWDGLKKFENNIVCLKKSELPSRKFNTVLVLDYMTITKTKGILNAKKILVISEKYTDNPKYFYSKSLYNVTYYGEMPFHYKDVEYRMKCLFDRYKKLGEVKKGTYINSPRNQNYLEVQDAIPELPRPLYFKSKTKPKENLFEQFTHYVYYHADKWFDPHPRLFLECEFYGKDITYINEYNIKDGSWFRYWDFRGILYNRTLNRDDEIIRHLI